MSASHSYMNMLGIHIDEYMQMELTLLIRRWGNKLFWIIITKVFAVEDRGRRMQEM